MDIREQAAQRLASVAREYADAVATFGAMDPAVRRWRASLEQAARDFAAIDPGPTKER